MSAPAASETRSPLSASSEISACSSGGPSPAGVSGGGNGQGGYPEEVPGPDERFLFRRVRDALPDLTVTDTTRHTTQTVKVTAVFYGTSGYNSAEILAMINNGTVTPPLTDTQLWKFVGSHVTAYSGKHGTIRGPWATSHYTDTTTETAAGATVMSASVLSSNGQNFTAWLRHR
jgi:hypothetical protein